jgi:hypothetical protein
MARDTEMMRENETEMGREMKGDGYRYLKEDGDIEVNNAFVLLGESRVFRRFFFLFGAPILIAQGASVRYWYWRIVSSVADPDPSDPYVFGPPGSGSICQRYES